MDNCGLLYKYRVNRPLKPVEIEKHLPVDKPSGVKPWFQLSVIRMNSTYLECLDKYFMHKGIATGFLVPIFFVFIGVLAFILVDSIMKYPYPPGELKEVILYGSLIYAMTLPCIYFIVLFIKKECFQYTHYPIRFNRKTRMVHVFRTNGTVLSVPWKNIFFTYRNLGSDTWEVCGMILNAPQNDTVLEVFPLTCRSTFKDEHVLNQWEFIRCYMEEPEMLQELADQVEWCADITDRKEEFMQGWKYMQLPFGHYAKLILPLLFLNAIARAFAMFCSKIPRWPEEVEASSYYSPNDPCLRDPMHYPTEEEFQVVYKKFHESASEPQ